MLTNLIMLGGVAVALMAALYFLPVLQPVLKWFGDNTPVLLDVVKEAVSDIMDNAKTLVFVLACVAASYTFGFYSSYDVHKEQVVKELRKDFKFIPRR